MRAAQRHTGGAGLRGTRRRVGSRRPSLARGALLLRLLGLCRRSCAAVGGLLGPAIALCGLGLGPAIALCGLGLGPAIALCGLGLGLDIALCGLGLALVLEIGRVPARALEPEPRRRDQPPEVRLCARRTVGQGRDLRAAGWPPSGGRNSGTHIRRWASRSSQVQDALTIGSARVKIKGGRTHRGARFVPGRLSAIIAPPRSRAVSSAGRAADF